MENGFKNKRCSRAQLEKSPKIMVKSDIHYKGNSDERVFLNSAQNARSMSQARMVNEEDWKKFEALRKQVVSRSGSLADNEFIPTFNVKIFVND
jgi:hypothetical protein